jgi:hypothetical protein
MTEDELNSYDYCVTIDSDEDIENNLLQDLNIVDLGLNSQIPDDVMYENKNVIDLVGNEVSHTERMTCCSCRVLNRSMVGQSLLYLKIPNTKKSLKPSSSDVKRKNYQQEMFCWKLYLQQLGLVTNCQFAYLTFF